MQQKGNRIILPALTNAWFAIKNMGFWENFIFIHLILIWIRLDTEVKWSSQRNWSFDRGKSENNCMKIVLICVLWWLSTASTNTDVIKMLLQHHGCNKRAYNDDDVDYVRSFTISNSNFYSSYKFLWVFTCVGWPEPALICVPANASIHFHEHSSFITI